MLDLLRILIRITKVEQTYLVATITITTTITIAAINFILTPAIYASLALFTPVPIFVFPLSPFWLFLRPAIYLPFLSILFLIAIHAMFPLFITAIYINSLILLYFFSPLILSPFTSFAFTRDKLIYLQLAKQFVKWTAIVCIQNKYR